MNKKRHDLFTICSKFRREELTMVNYEGMINRQRKWMLYLLALLIIGASFTPYSAIFLGLLLGSSISFYNHILLHKKIDQLAEKVIKEEKPKGLGTVSRLAAVSVAVLIALRFPEKIHLIALIIGFMASYLIMIVDFIRQTMRVDTERGEKGGK